MRNYIRQTAAVLAVVMCSVCLVTTAFAAEEAVDEAVYSYAAQNAGSDDIKVWDFEDNTKPADIGCGSGVTLSFADGKMAMEFAGNPNATLNLGLPSASVNFSTSEYKYLKLVIKNTAVSQASKDSLNICLIRAGETAAFAQANFNEDINGNIIKYSDGLYREYIFDLSQIAEDSIVGWIQLRPFRQSSDGIAYFERVSISNNPEYESEIKQAALKSPADGTQGYIFEPMTLRCEYMPDSDVEYIDYYVNSKLVGRAEQSPFTLSYVPDFQGNLDIKAQVNYSDGTVITTDTVTAYSIQRTDYTGEKWDFEADTQGWISNSLADVSAANSALVFSAKGKSAPLVKSAIGVDGSRYSVLKIRMKNTTSSSKIIIQWVVEGGTWTTDNKLTLTKDSQNNNITSKDDEFKEYFFDMSGTSWSKNVINVLQIFPCDQVESGTVYIDSIEICDVPPQISLSVPTDALVFPRQAEFVLNVAPAFSAIEKTELVINATPVKVYTGEVEAASYRFVPAKANNTAFLRVTDSLGRIYVSQTVEIEYTVPVEVMQVGHSISGENLEINMSLKKADEQPDSIIVVCAYSQDGEMQKALSVTAAAGADPEDNFVGLTLDETVAFVRVYLWENLYAGYSYMEPYHIEIK